MQDTTADAPDYAIAIDIATRYLDEQSKPDEELYYFAYTIGIRNTGTRAARLISRRWLIVDAIGFPREVVGEGVVGEQPHLHPGERFEYTSSTFFKTPYGTMEGAYVMRGDDGTEFEAPIPQFVLCIPRMLH
ncbi:MAG TPA: Co2+/Mg2+ efflux protein ApaG [Xanthomonadaceae bacterium]|jgi:ApaG protein